MQLLALHVKTPSIDYLMELANAPINFSSTLLETVYLVLVDAIFVQLLILVLNAVLLYFYKVVYAKELVTTDLHHLETNVLVAPLDAFNALKILSAIIVLTINISTKVVASMSVLLVPSAIDQLEIGNVFLATLLAKHVWIIHHIVQVVRMEKDIYKPQLCNNLVS